MRTYGVDYLDDSDDTIKFFIVDGESLEEAKREAHRILISYGIPKRNIVNIEHLNWLD